VTSAIIVSQICLRITQQNPVCLILQQKVSIDDNALYTVGNSSIQYRRWPAESRLCSELKSHDDLQSFDELADLYDHEMIRLIDKHCPEVREHPTSRSRSMLQPSKSAS